MKESADNQRALRAMARPEICPTLTPSQIRQNDRESERLIRRAMDVMTGPGGSQNPERDERVRDAWRLAPS